MQLTKEEYQYSKDIYHELYIKKSISTGYASFFGDHDFSFFENQLSDVRFYLYRPSRKYKQALIQEYHHLELHYKLDILKTILSSASYSIDFSSLKKSFLSQKGNYFSFLKQFFGASFLNTFDEENLEYLPYVLQCKKEGKWKKLKELTSVFSTLTESFDHLRRIQFTIHLYENMPDEPMNRVMLTFKENGTKETFGEKKERIFEQFLLRDDYGTCFFSSCGKHIFIPFYASLNTIFHEMGHFFFTKPIFTFSKFFLPCAKYIEGVFQSYNNVAIEVFTEFLANHSIDMISSASWSYLIKEKNQYASLLPIIEPFWNQFRSLIIYYMKENRPNVLLELLGVDFLEYKKFLESFAGFDSRISSTDLDMVSYYVLQMKKHFIHYDVNYANCFLQQVQTLKNHGHRVRILKKKKKKLIEEETMISNVSKTLSEN